MKKTIVTGLVAGLLAGCSSNKTHQDEVNVLKKTEMIVPDVNLNNGPFFLQKKHDGTVLVRHYIEVTRQDNTLNVVKYAVRDDLPDIKVAWSEYTYLLTPKGKGLKTLTLQEHDSGHKSLVGSWDIPQLEKGDLKSYYRLTTPYSTFDNFQQTQYYWTIQGGSLAPSVQSENSSFKATLLIHTSFNLPVVALTQNQQCPVDGKTTTSPSVTEGTTSIQMIQTCVNGISYITAKTQVGRNYLNEAFAYNQTESTPVSLVIQGNIIQFSTKGFAQSKQRYSTDISGI